MGGCGPGRMLLLVGLVVVVVVLGEQNDPPENLYQGQLSMPAPPAPPALPAPVPAPAPPPAPAPQLPFVPPPPLTKAEVQVGAARQWNPPSKYKTGVQDNGKVIGPGTVQPWCCPCGPYGTDGYRFCCKCQYPNFFW